MSPALAAMIAAAIGAAIGLIVFVIVRSQGVTLFHGQKRLRKIHDRLGAPGLAVAAAGMAAAAWWVILLNFFGAGR
jgi:hypothetical protein